jgi:2-keto-4-pentenoate hydratase/2-oxohepta-3-ene-1,7-dioic acid hydratase in catechol pathway
MGEPGFPRGKGALVPGSEASEWPDGTYGYPETVITPCGSHVACFWGQKRGCGAVFGRLNSCESSYNVARSLRGSYDPPDASDNKSVFLSGGAAVMFRRCLSLVLTVALITVITSSGGMAGEKKTVKFARFQMGKIVSYGIVEGDDIRRIEGNLFGEWKPTEEKFKISEVTLLVPTQPTKVVAAAGNYKSHLSEDTPVPKAPELFFKVPSCLIAQGKKVVIPQGTERVDGEAELVIVIGKRAKDVEVDKAMDHVLGITCGNDISARDWQQNDVQWWRAKGSDTFGPCGPFVVSGLNYDDLLLQFRLNGDVRQSQRTRDMIHGVAQLVSFASCYVTLEPGDLIYTGTPGKTATIKPGDIVEVEIEGVGVLRNPVVGR